MKTQHNYQSNSLSGLKREALGVGDLNLLRDIKRYESVTRFEKVCYIREGEDQLYNKQGFKISPDELPISPEWRTGLVLFCSVQLGKKLAAKGSDAGELKAIIQRYTIQSEKNAWTILELPKGVEFPLTSDWQSLCTDATPAIKRESKQSIEGLHRELILHTTDKGFTYPEVRQIII